MIKQEKSNEGLLDKYNRFIDGNVTDFACIIRAFHHEMPPKVDLEDRTTSESGCLVGKKQYWSIYLRISI
ncbi:MAG: hypothetical protein IK008_00965 [Bacteroidales bacterium]|nr:hypothetical protein [Bacteroidales bacterium]